MKYFTTGGATRVHVIQLDPDDELLESIEEFILLSGMTDGVVVSGVGTLRRCALHMVTTTDFPPVEVYPVYEDKALELTGMQGIIAAGVPHIHMTVSDQDSAVGGHLEHGSIVLYLAEVAILELPGIALSRVPNDRNILKLVQGGTAPQNEAQSTTESER